MRIKLLFAFLLIFVGNVYSQWLGNPNTKTIICSTSSDARLPMSVPSGDGGSIVVFANLQRIDEDPYTIPMLCVQKITSNGTVAWGAADAPVIVDSLIHDDWLFSPKLTIGADGSGGVYIAWAETFYSDSVFAQHVNANGQLIWETGGKLAYAQAGQEIMDGLSICTGPNNSMLLSWNAKSGTGRYSMYAQRYNAAGTAQWGADGKEVCMAAGSRKGGLITDGAGGAIAVFYDSRTNGMYAQRVDSAGNLRWAADGVNICPVPGARYISPGIMPYGEATYAVPDGNGGAIVFFNDKRNVTLDNMYGQTFENNIDVYAQKIDADGNLPWGQDGVAVAVRQARVNDICEKVCSDGNGGAIVQYESLSNMWDGTCKLVQRISANGTRQWGDSGIVLTRGRIDEFYSSIQTDESGNTYAGFLYIPDPYNEQANPLLALRKINLAGQDMWGSNGVLVRNQFLFVHPFFGPAISPQNDGSAIAAWSEPGTYYMDIAGAKVLANGTLAKSPTTFTTVANGNWDDPTIWAGGIVPDDNVIVVIKNQIIINVNISCYSLKVETPDGSIKVNPGITVDILH